MSSVKPPPSPQEPDWLAAAARATRTEFDGSSELARQTERAVVEQLRARRRRKVPWSLLALAALVGSSPAWAAQARDGVRWLSAALAQQWASRQGQQRLEHPGPAAQRAERAAAVVSALPSSAPNGDPSVAISADTDADTNVDPSAATRAVFSASAPARDPLPRSQSPRAVAPNVDDANRSALAQGAPSGSIVPQPSAVAQDAALALYAEAHAAHFVRQDWGAALTAWDRYLAQASGSQLLPEARYNRAIALVKLGRNAEARAALLPFAQHAYGSYRAKEASVLLFQLGPAESP